MKQGISCRVGSVLSVVLSLALLGACADVQKAQQPRPVPIRQVQQGQVKAPPSNPSAYYYFLLSQFKLKDGKIDEAIEDLKTAISYEDKDPSLHVELATLYIHKGFLNDAIEECKTALINDPDLLSAHLLLGGIYTSLKKNRLAIESYNRAIEIDARHRETYLLLGSLYEEEKEYE